MKRISLKTFYVFLFGIFIFQSVYCANGKKESKDTNTKWSVEIADAFISRNPEYIAYDTSRIIWQYEQGLMHFALWKLWEKTGDNKYYNYIKSDIDNYIDESGNIRTYDFETFKLDDVTPGRVALILYEKTKDEKYKKAADLLMKQLMEQPRTKESGFWHKQIYIQQMWLDGLYMAEPFYALYSKMFNQQKNFDDIAHQFILMAEKAKDPKTGLFYHAWDSSKKQKWADSETGQSPNFWGRAIGWYLMGIVDVLDYFPTDHPKREKLIIIFQDLSSSVLKYQDEKTNLWYQVVDKGNQKGNYLEATASSMFMYSFAKGAKKGYLDEKFLGTAKKVYNGIIDNLIIEDKDGMPGLIQCCSVSGLGGNPYRDGSFEYYVNEPIRKNDFKGLGPFILGALEVENANIGQGKHVGLDYYFNNEWKKDKTGKDIRYHYIWEDEEFSGYSEVRKILTANNAVLSAITNAPNDSILSRLNLYIIVDPDTPKENPNPNYIDQKSIEAIVKWVKAGGVLCLFGNDKGNSEFEHFNRLAENFGIHFNEDSRNRVTGNEFDMGKFDVFPEHPIFKDVRKLYLKELSTLSLIEPAKAILTDNNDIIMASAEFGKGFVFAVGDPWLYNEYIDNRKLPEGFTNKIAAENLFEWLLGKTSIEIVN